MVALVVAQERPVSGAEQVVTLGDSLTFAYEASFGFEVTIQFQGTFGDNFGPEVKNWVEILHDPVYRNAFFDQGARDDIRLQTTFFPEAQFTDLFFRREYNWAVPGMRIDQLRRFLNEEATALELLGENPSFALLQTALALSDFENSDFDVADLRNQIANTAERLVLFIGGNDINQVYGPIYNGDGAGTFVTDFMDDALFVINWIQNINPNIQIVIAGVPHVGITPDVKATYPTDAVKTGRVTEVLKDLNTRLANLAALRNLGFADIFTSTLNLLSPNDLCIHGIPFMNTGSVTGDLDFVWLNGPLSANFHPNTSAHTLIANELIHAFNRTYQTGIAPLTATEMLSGLLGKSAAEIDMPFATWMSCYGLTGLSVSDDSDQDGILAGLEFALGLNPTRHDSEFVSQRLVNTGGSLSWEMAYPIRLPGSARYTLIPSTSSTLGGFSPLLPTPTVGADGRAKAVLPLTGGAGFLRLESSLVP